MGIVHNAKYSYQEFCFTKPPFFYSSFIQSDDHREKITSP